MAQLRKKWSTIPGKDQDKRRHHESRAQAYRHVANDAANWAAGTWQGVPSRRYTTVWVDERDGQGWRLFERVDLATYGAGEQ